MTWIELGEWWLTELSDDPAYESVVTPMLLDILSPEPGKLYLDLGSGEGRVMRAVADLGARAHGIEINSYLAARSTRAGPTVIGSLPDLGFLREGSYDGAYCVLVLEHLADHRRLFREAARVVAPGGVFALVANHPTWTAPDSTPISDAEGEVLYRPGEYLSVGTSSEVPAGEATVTFHHRAMADLLNAAAEAGWGLVRMAEAAHHEFEDQLGIPRLLACRWSLLA